MHHDSSVTAIKKGVSEFVTGSVVGAKHHPEGARSAAWRGSETASGWGEARILLSKGFDAIPQLGGFLKLESPGSITHLLFET